MTFFSTSELLEIGGVPFISHNPKPTRREAMEYYRRVQSSWGLKVKLYEAVQMVTKKEGGYQVETAKNSYMAKSIVIATGFYDVPKLMNVPGEDLPKVKHYYDDPHLYASQRVAVVGAANSAIDAALETYRKDAEVTLIVRGAEISPRVKYWIRPDIENRIKEGAIKVYFNSSVESISAKTISIKSPEGVVTIENDHVLAMTGYQPDFSFLRKIGIEIANDEVMRPSHHAESHESNLPNIYLAGVVCGGMYTSKWFIENSRDHAGVIIGNILRKKREVTN